MTHPRIRRAHMVGVAAAIGIIYLLFFSGSPTTDFRKTTEEGMARQHGVLRGDLSDADLTAQTNRELQAILAKQHPSTASSNERPVQSVSSQDDEISVAGRKSMPRPQEKPKYPVGNAGANGDETAFNGNKVETAIDEGEEMVREELQGILKKSPIIIFSKSYCPYSKRAKALLLETYTITPAPYVVELDLMTQEVPRPQSHSDPSVDDDNTPPSTLGRKLQDLLATLTGRKTVPNITINSQSLGGSDDIVRMDTEGTLIDEIKKLGGNRIVSIEKSGS